ncbi:MAG: hypothetical protein H0U20_00115 [Thermoleophilaceae bacterium]|jgi:hypothetical protein|nr:hypothetical protein [Thermoleophilaceae bacterium]
MRNAGEIASAVGKGLFAGAAGTVFMTISSTIEAKLTDRGPSSAPADAAGKVLGVQPRDEKGQARFSNAVHWGYGTGWGAVRGLIGLSEPSMPAATGAHFAAVWGSSLVMLPALDVAPAPWKQPASGLATDALHHMVYAVGTSVAYALIDS